MQLPREAFKTAGLLLSLHFVDWVTDNTDSTWRVTGCTKLGFQLGQAAVHFKLRVFFCPAEDLHMVELFAGTGAIADAFRILAVSGIR